VILLHQKRPRHRSKTAKIFPSTTFLKSIRHKLGSLEFLKRVFLLEHEYSFLPYNFNANFSLLFLFHCENVNCFTVFHNRAS